MFDEKLISIGSEKIMGPKLEVLKFLLMTLSESNGDGFSRMVWMMLNLNVI